MMMPMVQMAAKMPSSFGFTALRSMIMEGRDSVVTPIIKDSTTPSRAPLGQQRLRNRNRAKDIRIHGDAGNGGDDHAKGIASSKNLHDKLFRNPVVDERADANAN